MNSFSFIGKYRTFPDMIECTHSLFHESIPRAAEIAIYLTKITTTILHFLARRMQ